jgi:nodulation protein E
MSARRVAVTGLGAICALGNNVAEVWHALSEGQPGIAPIQAVNRSLLRFQNAAEVTSFHPAEYFEASRLDLLDRFAQFAIVAAREAVADAGLCAAEGNPAKSACARPRELGERTAVVVGSCAGGLTTQESQYIELYQRGQTRIHPLAIPRTMANAAASQVAMELGARGPAFAISTACASASHSLGQAMWLVRSGAAELAVAGGSEAPFSLAHLKAWEAMRVVAPDTCRPFCRERRGMILGEGAAMLVLEPLEAAQARGARIFAELAGFGMSSDAQHITQPSAEGAARAMRAALADAGLAAEQIGYVNAHGTGTAGNDPAEIRAIRAALGAHAERLAVSSTKSMHGHTLGAAGAIEAVATVLALDDGLLPPTANFLTPDPECDLDVIPNMARRAAVEAALSNSFAFGGLNAVLAFRKIL